MKRALILFLFILGISGVVGALNQKSSNYQKSEFKIITINGKKGLENAKGKVVIPALYEDIGWSNGLSTPMTGVIGFQLNGLWGIISVSNRIVADAEYVHLSSNASNEYVIAAKSDSLSKTRLYGVLSAKGRVVIPFNYSVLVEVGGLLIAAHKRENEEKYGLINFTNEKVLAFQYDNIYSISSKLLVLHKPDNYIEIYHLDHQNIIHQGLTKLELRERGYFNIYKGLKCGLIDENGNILAPIDYKELRWKNDHLQGLKYSNWTVCTGENRVISEVECDDIVFKEDKAILIGLNNQLLVDRYGSSITRGNFETIDNVVGRQVVFKEGDKYGIYDGVKQQIVKQNIDSLLLEGEFFYSMMVNKGRTVWAITDTFQIKRNKYEYDLVKPHHSRSFAVKRNGYWGFIARNGFEIIPCKYDSVGEFVVNDVVVRVGNEDGIISISGRWSVPLRKAKIELLSHLHFLSREEGKTKLEKMNGELIYSTDNKLEYINGLLWEFREDSTIIKLDLQGKILTEPYNFTNSAYEEIKYIYDDWVAVKLKGKYGFFNTKTGKLRISTRYEDVGRANNGDIITVKILGKWGAIDMNEEFVIQPNYDSIYYFIDGVAITRANGQYGLITDKGEVILNNRYEQMQRQGNGRLVTKEDGKFGLIDSDGKVVIIHKYDSLQDTSNGYAIIRIGKKFGVVTLNGVSTVPQVYDNLRYNLQSDMYFAEIKRDWETISQNNSQ